MKKVLINSQGLKRSNLNKTILPKADIDPSKIVITKLPGDYIKVDSVLEEDEEG